MMAVAPPMTVAETEGFLNRAKAVLTETERAGLLGIYAKNEKRFSRKPTSVA